MIYLKTGCSKVTAGISFPLHKFAYSCSSVVSRNFLKSEGIFKVFVTDSLRSFISLCHWKQNISFKDSGCNSSFSTPPLIQNHENYSIFCLFFSFSNNFFPWKASLYPMFHNLCGMYVQKWSRRHSGVCHWQKPELILWGEVDHTAWCGLNH